MSCVMRAVSILVLLAAAKVTLLAADPPRFVVDDEAFLEQVTRRGARLLKAGRLVTVTALRAQPRRQDVPLRLASPEIRRLTPPDLYDRLRESTLAVGTLYRCRECTEWHFNASTGFVISENGVVSTCCHVVMTDLPEVQEAYLLAADATGKAYPVQAVLARDTEADTCLIKIEATGLKPLPLRPNVRTGERVYCLSNPGGNHFMFTEGLVARVTRSRNEPFEDAGKTNAALTRPILFLNVTAEYAPGSSGAPIVDESGNVVGQAVSLADAGESDAGGTDEAPLPPLSVPVRFCIAAEEMLDLLGRYARESKAGKPGTSSPGAAARTPR